MATKIVRQHGTFLKPSFLEIYEYYFHPLGIAFSVTYVTLAIGLSDSIFSKFMQIGGIVASPESVAKTCAADHLTKIDADKKEPDFSTTIKTLLFFGPHVLWRTTATGFVAAFLKF